MGSLQQAHSIISTNQDTTQEAVLTASFSPSLRAFGLKIFGKKQQETIERTEEEVKRLERSIALIARVFSNNYELELLPSSLGTWACSLDPEAVEKINEYISRKTDSLRNLPDELFKPKQILYEVSDLKHLPEEQILGVLRHEIGHAKRSDYRLFFEGQRFAQDQGCLPSTWANIHNALEDPWINEGEIQDSDVVREQITSYYARSIPEVVSKINSQPLARQLTLNIVHYWATQGKSIPTLKNKQVKQLFQSLKPHVDAYIAGDTAQENFDLLKSKIWDSYKVLEQSSVKDQELKDIAHKIADLAEQDSATKESPWSRFKKKVKKFKDWIKRKLFPRSATRDTNDLDLESFNKLIKENLSKEQIKQFNTELKKQISESDKKDTALKKSEAKLGNLENDLDLDRLPPKLRKALDKILNLLPLPLKQNLEQVARQNLDYLQVKAIKDDLPKGMLFKKNDESGEYQLQLGANVDQATIEQQKQLVQQIVEKVEHSEVVEQAELQAQRQADLERELAQQQEEAIQREMHEAGFNEHERKLYEKYKYLEGAMLERTQQFIRMLREYLPKKQKMIHAGEFYTGAKLNNRGVIKRAATGDHRYYSRKERTASEEPRMFVELIIDNSGSMDWDGKMIESLKTAIFWSRVLKELDVPFCIKFFDRYVTTIKTFDQDFDDPRAQVKANLVRCGDAGGGWTDMGKPLQEAYSEMRTAKHKYPGSMGAAFMISDSGANQGLVGKELRNLIEKFQSEFVVMNFILASDDSEVEEAKEYFGSGNVVAPEEFTDLPEEAFQVLRQVLNNALRRLRLK